MITYDSNNSGGGWWLSDDDWFNLEKAGWTVHWKKDSKYGYVDEDGRWLGALATSASRDLPMDEAIVEWESITGEDPDAAGCPCCGQPHHFYEDD